MVEERARELAKQIGEKAVSSGRFPYCESTATRLIVAFDQTQEPNEHIKKTARELLTLLETKGKLSVPEYVLGQALAQFCGETKA